VHHVLAVVSPGERLDDRGLAAGHAVAEQLEDGGCYPLTMAFSSAEPVNSWGEGLRALVGMRVRWRGCDPGRDMGTPPRERSRLGIKPVTRLRLRGFDSLRGGVGLPTKQISR
jgi:hypothetical protein